MSTEVKPRAKPSQRTRIRYMLIQVDPTGSPPGREALIRALQGAAAPEWSVWLTRFDGSHAIVRVRRDGADAFRRFLDANAARDFAGARLRPLLTSGSIAGLERKHRGAAALRQGRR